MREVLADVRATIIEAIILLGAGYFIYKKLRGDAITLTDKIPSAAVVADSAKQIVQNTPKVVASLLRGESDQGYITREQQAALSAQRLAEKRAQAAVVAGAE